MLHEIERSSLDLRYEDRRLKNRVQEGRLLSSIAERGIDEPLEGVSTDDARVLLNRFKRYRCATRLRAEEGTEESSTAIARPSESRRTGCAIVSEHFEP